MSRRRRESSLRHELGRKLVQERSKELVLPRIKSIVDNTIITPMTKLIYLEGMQERAKTQNDPEYIPLTLVIKPYISKLCKEISDEFLSVPYFLNAYYDKMKVKPEKLPSEDRLFLITEISKHFYHFHPPTIRQCVGLGNASDRMIFDSLKALVDMVYAKYQKHSKSMVVVVKENP